MQKLSCVVPVILVALSASAAEPLVARSTRDEPTFRFEEKKGGYLDCLYGKTPISRFMMAFDPTRLEETYRPFLHIYDFDGKEFITKGAGGKFPHHRGVFIGWSEIRTDHQTYDLWNLRPKDSPTQRFVRFVNDRQQATADLARVSAEIDWYTADGTPLIRETREWTVYPPLPKERLFDFRIELRSLRGPLRLDGNLQHAGFHFRAVQEVADHEQDRPATFLFPPGFQGGMKEAEQIGSCPSWAAMLFEARHEKFGVMLMNHPKNGGTPVLSTRAYGRFGFFSPYDLTAEKSLILHYRLLVFDATVPPPTVTLDARYGEFVQPSAARGQLRVARGEP